MRIALLAALALTASYASSAAAQPAEQRAERITGSGFDSAPPGPLTEWTTENDLWIAVAGEAFVDPNRGRDRSQSLRLAGGESSSVQWTPDLTDAEPVELVFWAQRWTRQAPFVFHVEAQIGGHWQALFDDHDAVPVGRFQRFVVPWPEGH